MRCSTDAERRCSLDQYAARCSSGPQVALFGDAWESSRTRLVMESRAMMMFLPRLSRTRTWLRSVRASCHSTIRSRVSPETVRCPCSVRRLSIREAYPVLVVSRNPTYAALRM